PATGRSRPPRRARRPGSPIRLAPDEHGPTASFPPCARVDGSAGANEPRATQERGSGARRREGGYLAGCSLATVSLTELSLALVFGAGFGAGPTPLRLRARLAKRCSSCWAAGLASARASSSRDLTLVLTELATGETRSSTRMLALWPCSAAASKASTPRPTG